MWLLQGGVGAQGSQHHAAVSGSCYFPVREKAKLCHTAPGPLTRNLGHV